MEDWKKVPHHLQSLRSHCAAQRPKFRDPTYSLTPVDQDKIVKNQGDNSVLVGRMGGFGEPTVTIHESAWEQ